MRTICLAILSMYFYSTFGLANSEIFVNEKNGLFTVTRGGGPLLSSKYKFWGNGWGWAGLKTNFKTIGPLKYKTLGNNKKLDFDLVSEVHKVNDNQVNWIFDLNSASLKQDAIGGGISFKLDISNLGSDLGNPMLIPNNQGWKWGNRDTLGLEVRFDPPLESVHFGRRGNKSEIRAFFYKGSFPEGKRRYTMTLSLFGDFDIKPTLSERFGTKNSQKWPEDSIDIQSFPVDLSFLNSDAKPAGKHGFVRSQGDELIFEDGTTARFWGTNITSYSLFKSSKTNIQEQAKRLSMMGFNLVRLFHHDSPWVNPNIFGKKKFTIDTQKLDKESLDKLDWWIKCLKDEGIYIWLDLHALRYMTENDKIFAYDEIENKKEGTKELRRKGINIRGYNYVNRSMIKAMKQFNDQYVTHVNSYTKLAYKDEPAIIAMLITNENDITFHFGNKLLPKKDVPKHSQLYMHEAKKFAVHHGLPVSKTWQAWKHGPAKLFLNDLEHRFNIEMIKALRDSGVKVPIATTNTWGKNTLASLPALTAGDIIDVHAYGGVLEVEKNPLFGPGMATHMAAAQIAGKPLSITEWNVSPFPAPDRHTSSLLVASKARHQGWDAIMQYAYSQGSLNKKGKPSNWNSHNDPAFLAMLPAAALLYRKQHVKEANTTYYLAPDESFFYDDISPKTSAAIRTASEKGKLLIAMPKTNSLPWLNSSVQPPGSTLIRNHKKSLIEPSASSVTSDTGELFRNWDEGIYTIDTEKSQAVMGWVGDKRIRLSDSEFQLTTQNATVAIQSLDDLGIRQSENILISLATVSIPSKDPKKRSILPFRSEPLKGTVFINAKKGLNLSYVKNSGASSHLPVNYNNGKYLIELDNLPVTHWLRLTL